MSTENSASDGNTPWALVTGASSGIGLEFARQLAAEGYDLVLTARRAELMAALAAELHEAHGTQALVSPADLAEASAPAEIVQRIEASGIHIEFLVNNAGYGLPGRYSDCDWKDHARFIQIMTTAVCELTWRLLGPMQRAGRGYIINVASVAGLIPGSEGHTLYAASKAYLVRFSESLALENERLGVAVSALCPGFTYSEFHDVTGTRELVSKFPAFMWLQAPEVVRYGIESVRRSHPRVVAIPGRVYRTLVRLNRVLPVFGGGFVKRLSKRFRKLD